jgi:hypothetical protein
VDLRGNAFISSFLRRASVRRTAHVHRASTAHFSAVRKRMAVDQRALNVAPRSATSSEPRPRDTAPEECGASVCCASCRSPQLGWIASIPFAKWDRNFGATWRTREILAFCPRSARQAVEPRDSSEQARALVRIAGTQTPRHFHRERRCRLVTACRVGKLRAVVPVRFAESGPPGEGFRKIRMAVS